MPEIKVSNPQISSVTEDNRYVYSHNNFGRGCHHIGRFLTLPVSLIANTTTKLFSHDRPGKSSTISEVDNSKHRLPLFARNIARVTAVTLLLVPSLVLGLLGLPFRLVGNLFRSDISLIQSSTQCSVYCTERGLHLMTYNTGLMPGFIRNLNDLRSSQRRSQEIAEALTSNPAIAPDVVCFQEVFDQQATKNLCEHLSSHYHHILHSVGPRETGLSSGLAVASKYPVLEATFRPFPDLAAEDRLANKGLLRVVLDLGNGKTAVVYNTHLQAKEGKTYESIRFDEMYQIREWIDGDNERDNRKHEGIFLMGDLNSAKVAEQGQDNKRSQYDNAFQALGKNFHNSYYETHDSDSGKRKVDRSNPFFVKEDQTGIENHDEPNGSWYLGAGSSERRYWGSNGWKEHPDVVAHCIYDYQLVYGDDNAAKWASHAEIRQIGLNGDNNLQSGLSDHLPLSVIYREARGFDTAIRFLDSENLTSPVVIELVDKLKSAVCDNPGNAAIHDHISHPLHKISEAREQNNTDPVAVNELNRLEKILRNSMNPFTSTQV